MRHTCATWLLQAGVDQRIANRIIGHAAHGMGARYAHIPDPELLTAIDKLPWRKFDVDDARAAASRGKSVEVA